MQDAIITSERQNRSFYGNFSAGALGSTRMACDNMSVENFMDMVGKANKYVVTEMFWNCIRTIFYF
jgi:hypothetical protein